MKRLEATIEILVHGKADYETMTKLGERVYDVVKDMLKSDQLDDLPPMRVDLGIEHGHRQ